MYRGKLGPSSEFHILRTKSHDYYDKRFWSKLFSQKQQSPAFLSAATELIFEAGKGINLLHLISKNVNLYNTQLFYFLEFLQL